MQPVLLTIHILTSIVLIVVVLIQSGRSGGFANLMGGGGDALFSTSSQQSGLRNLTLIVAGVFLATSLGLTILARSGGNQSVFQRRMPALPPVNAPAPDQGETGSQPWVPADQSKK